MERLIFGISLMFCGIIGVSVLLICGTVLSDGAIHNGSPSIFTFLRFRDMISAFFIFSIMLAIGIVICTIEYIRTIL